MSDSAHSISWNQKRPNIWFNGAVLQLHQRGFSGNANSSPHFTEFSRNQCDAPARVLEAGREAMQPYVHRAGLYAALGLPIDGEAITAQVADDFRRREVAEAAPTSANTQSEIAPGPKSGELVESRRDDPASPDWSPADDLEAAGVFAGPNVAWKARRWATRR